MLLPVLPRLLPLLLLLLLLPRQAMVPVWDLLNHITGDVNVRLHHCSKRWAGLSRSKGRTASQGRESSAAARARLVHPRWQR